MQLLQHSGHRLRWSSGGVQQFHAGQICVGLKVERSAANTGGWSGLAVGEEVSEFVGDGGVEFLVVQERQEPSGDLNPAIGPGVGGRDGGGENLQGDGSFEPADEVRGNCPEPLDVMGIHRGAARAAAGEGDRE